GAAPDRCRTAGARPRTGRAGRLFARGAAGRAPRLVYRGRHDTAEGRGMTDVPFGFGSSDRSPEERRGGQGDPFGVFPLFAELQKLMSWQGGPVNWDLARQLAGEALSGTSRTATPAERQQGTGAIRLADLGLDGRAVPPPGVRTADAWTRLEWVDRTLPVWSALCDPVASRVVGAMGSALPPEAMAQAGQLLGVLNSVGGMMFGAQVGQALAGLAHEVLTPTHIGLPLGPPWSPASPAATIAPLRARPD